MMFRQTLTGKGPLMPSFTILSPRARQTAPCRLLLALMLVGCLLPGRAASKPNPFPQIYAHVQKDPAQITLEWTFDTSKNADPVTVKVARKGLDDPMWGAEVAVPGENPTRYTDAVVEVGRRYEYRVVQQWAYSFNMRTSHRSTTLFLCSGIEAAPRRRAACCRRWSPDGSAALAPECAA